MYTYIHINIPVLYTTYSIDISNIPSPILVYTWVYTWVYALLWSLVGLLLVVLVNMGKFMGYLLVADFGLLMVNLINMCH